MNRTLIILISCVVAIFLLIAIFFEFKDVPEIKRGGNYDIEAQEMRGLLMFKEMLNTKYGENNVEVINSLDHEYLKDQEGGLLVLIEDVIRIDSSGYQAIKEFQSRNNEVLVIGNYFSIDSLSCDMECDFEIDTTFEFNWVDDATVYHYDTYVTDSIVGNRSKMMHFSENSEDDLLLANGTMTIFKNCYEDGFSLSVHSFPELFTNIASMNDCYLENFNKTFSQFSSSRVILHRDEKSDLAVGLNDQSLLQFIMSQPALKAAYMLTILLTLLFVIFSSKRKLREVPLLERQKNTSLDYVATISDIFMSQDQNEKLVRHMKTIFFHKVRSDYYLRENDASFAMKLSKKSQVPIDLINSILNQLSAVDSHRFDDYQIIRLYQNIETYNKTRK